MVLANSMEPFRDVRNRSAGSKLSWQIASMDGAVVHSSSGLRIQPDCSLSKASPYQTLILIAGYQVRNHINSKTKRVLSRAAKKAKLVIGLDTASWLLASAGVLEGHRATIHWQEIDSFAEEFPTVEVLQQQYVQSGQFITCGAASFVLELIIELIEQEFGQSAAFNAATMFVYDLPSDTLLGSGTPAILEKRSGILLKVLHDMAENIEQPVSIQELAARVPVSVRTLHRVFNAQLGVAPGKYYQTLRLQRAHNLANETDMSVQQISFRCGFSSTAAMSRAYVNEFNISISSSRRLNKRSKLKKFRQ